ncbi:MAG TPA: helix-turn-helix domain-containing protein [Burkholderiaceae bacterium]|nr:helix-turn-helix domain-containing protein [Burkholderiaceae bacterium]
MTQRTETAAGALPAQPFFSTPQQRLALARQRYFDEGVRPSGLVHESLIQSWSRCVQARRDPGEHVAFQPVSSSRTHTALQRSRLLVTSAARELRQLEATLAGTGCTAILTDAQGVVVHANRSAGEQDAVLLPIASRIGVDLTEEEVGTTAPGMALRTGQSSVVLGGEHFFGCLQVMYCAAAPIRDIHGQVAGVLDVSSESRPFGFDAAAVVNLAATTIENRLLRAQSTEHIVVHLQTAPSLIGTPMEGLAGLDAHGRLAWVNTAAARLLGLAWPTSGAPAENVFGLDLAALARLTRHDGASVHRLPNGLMVWLVARMQSNDGAGPLVGLGGGVASGPDAAASRASPNVNMSMNGHPTRASLTAASTLRDNDRQLIEQTVRACGGNVSKAARTLGVSRGLIYRHLKTANV